MLSPTARSLRLLRDSGFVVGIVERWIPHANKRSDLYGVGDVLAVSRRERLTLLVQCTSASNISSRVKKAQRSAELLVWLRAGNSFEVHGWNSRGEVKRVSLSADNLSPSILQQPRRRRRDRQPDLFADST